MDQDQPAGTKRDRRIALLIDADNVSHSSISMMLSELSRYGVANIRRAYGDWASASLKGWKGKLHEYAIQPMQQFSYSKGKNATDMALTIDAMVLLYTQKLDAFCIASSDADFTPLVMQLRANGHEVYGFGARKTPEPFVNACSTFLYLDAPAAAAEAIAAPRAPARASSAAAKTAAPAPARAPAAPAAAKAPALQSPGEDSKLIAILRGAVEATADDEGWAPLDAAGSAAKRQAPIDPRNYGCRNFPKLFEATGLFEIVKVESGPSYVADKDNLDRAKKPRAAPGRSGR